MAAPHVKVLTTLGFDSLKHRVEDWATDVNQADIHETGDMGPLAGQMRPRVGAQWSGGSFTTRLAGSGAAGTAPLDDALWLAVGATGTNAAAVSETYDGFLPKNETPTQIDIYQGNALKEVIANAVGSLRMEFNAGETAKAIWSMMGTYVAPTEAAIGDAFGSSADPPVAKNMTITINTETLVVRSMFIDLNNEISSPRYDLEGTNGVANPLIVNVQPEIGFVVETPDFSDIDLQSALANETKITASIQLGSTAGNILTITMDAYMNAPLVRAWDNNLLVDQVGARMSWEDGDTQLTAVYT